MSIFNPLLTKEERETLGRNERRNLRDRRREQKKADRPRIGVKLPKLRARAEDLIFDLMATTLPGRQRMNEVLDSLAEEADDLLEWSWAGPFLSGPLEAIDGLVMHIIVRTTIRPHVQRLYDELEKSGRLKEPRDA